jgi:hypothetical protein
VLARLLHRVPSLPQKLRPLILTCALTVLINCSANGFKQVSRQSRRSNHSRNYFPSGSGTIIGCLGLGCICVWQGTWERGFYDLVEEGTTQLEAYRGKSMQGDSSKLCWLTCPLIRVYLLILRILPCIDELPPRDSSTQNQRQAGEGIVPRRKNLMDYNTSRSH